MGFSQDTVASALLPHVRSQETADRLFRKAHHVERGMRSAPSSEVARQYVRKNLSKAIMIASDTRTDPSVLLMYLKDTRVAVRSALAENPSLPYEGLGFLADWAAERKDSSAIRFVVPRMTPDDACAFLLRNAEHLQDYSTRWQSSILPVEELVSLLAPRGDLVKNAVACRSGALNAALGYAAYTGKVKGLSFPEFMAVLPEYQVPEVALAVLAECEFLSADLVAVLPDKAYVHPEDIALVEPEALPLLGRLSTRNFTAALLLGLPESEALSILKDAHQADPRSGLLLKAVLEGMSRGRKFSPAFEKKVTEFALETETEAITLSDGSVHARGFLPESLHGLLAELSHRLSEDYILEVLRRLPYRSLYGWLTRESVNGPTADLVSEILRDPGLAFCDARYVRARMAVQMDEHTREEIASQMAQSLGHWGYNPFGIGYPEEVNPGINGVLTEFIDAEIPSRMYMPGIATLVAARCEELFGTSEEHWDTFLVLACDWSGSLSELLSSVLSLAGPVPPQEGNLRGTRSAAPVAAELLLELTS